MSPFSYFLAGFNAVCGGILYAMDSRGWVLQVLLMALIMVEAIVSAIKSRS